MLCNVQQSECAATLNTVLGQQQGASLHLVLWLASEHVLCTQGMALALGLVALAAWLLWDWLQHRLRARERELANSLTQDMDVDAIKRLVGEVRCSKR